MRASPDEGALLLEIGAGGNVPTVRVHSEATAKAAAADGAEVALVRVNPEFPCADSALEKAGVTFVPMMTSGLVALKAIDASVDDLRVKL